MVTYSQLRGMDTSKLATAGSTSGELSRNLATRAGQVRSKAQIPAGTWDAADADAASALLEKQESPLNDASNAFRTGKAALEDLVEGLEDAKGRLDDAHDLVAGTGVTINADGSVTTPSVDNPAKAATNASVAKQASQVIQQALRMAENADSTASDALQAADLDVDADSIPDGDGDSAQDVHDWWNSLSQAERKAYIQEHPEKIGMLDGIPAEDRHKANMDILRHDAEHGDDKENAQALLDKVEKSQKGPEDQRIHLLGYEPPELEANGEMHDAKVIAAVGNPDTADRTSVFVPGMGSDLGNADSYIANAEDLQTAAANRASGESVSSIMWMGYDAPDGLDNATQGHYAQSAAPALREFSSGLEANNADSRNTFIGHSYGSTVVGTADAGGNNGLNANNVVAVGSPGLGYDESGDKIENQEALNTHEDHVWTGTTTDDPIRWGDGNHGTLPAKSAFGANEFSVDGSSGHSEYFEKNSESLRNQARIIVEGYDAVEEDRGYADPNLPAPAPR